MLNTTSRSALRATVRQQRCLLHDTGAEADSPRAFTRVEVLYITIVRYDSFDGLSADVSFSKIKSILCLTGTQLSKAAYLSGEECLV